MTDPWLETLTFYLKPGCRLLDLGAGEGRFARLFASSGMTGLPPHPCLTDGALTFTVPDDSVSTLNHYVRPVSTGRDANPGSTAQEAIREDPSWAIGTDKYVESRKKEARNRKI